jgi:hypothetical protein
MGPRACVNGLRAHYYREAAETEGSRLSGAVDKSPSESKRHARGQRSATTRPPDLAGNRRMLDRWPREFTLDRYQLR